MIAQRYLVLIFGAATIVLLFTLSLNAIGYQDAWILQSVLVPTLVYVIVFACLIAHISDMQLIAVLSSSFLIILNAIPNLKYELFYGTYDSAEHYGFIAGLLSLGHVPQTGFYAIQYEDFPGMHILISTLCLLLGISPNDAIKLFTSIVSGIIPLMIYLATNHTFGNNLQKGILLASGLPAVSGLYSLSGSTFGYVLFFGFICVLLRKAVSAKLSKQLTVVLLIMGYGLLFSHLVSLVYLLITLSASGTLLAFDEVAKKRQFDYGNFGIVLVLALSFMTVQAFRAETLFEAIVASVQSVFAQTSISGGIPATFFLLPLSAQASLLLVTHADDAIFTALSLIGLCVLLKKFRPANPTVFHKFYLPLLGIIGVLTLMMLFQLAAPVGGLTYARPLGYMTLFESFLVGFVLWNIAERLTKIRIRNIILATFLVLVVTSSFIELYPLQTIVPKANTLSPDLPNNEYVFDYRSVNTIYSIESIIFAQKYSASSARITSDVVTRNQIYGFADQAFSDRHVYYSPLRPNFDSKWDILLLHYDGSAGSLNEPAAYRTQEYVRTIRDTWGNVVYDNGGYFIIAHV
jgi:hypothetical protein